MTATSNTLAKKHLVVSFEKLPIELQEAVKAAYPSGYYDSMIRVDKPNGDFFYAVPYETSEISYLVKINVQIDDMTDEEDEKDIYGEDDDNLTGTDEIRSDDADDDAIDDVPAEFDDPV